MSDELWVLSRQKKRMTCIQTENGQNYLEESVVECYPRADKGECPGEGREKEYWKLKK